MKDGRPRYFMCLESCIGPRVAKISSLASCVVLGLKKTEDLSVLIFWPEASSYFWRICFYSWLSPALALQKRMLSFAKKMWVTLGQPLQIKMSVKSWFQAASWMSAESPSIQMRKRVGERGSLCLSPRVGVMFPQAALFIITKYETEVMHLITRFTRFELNPSFSMTPCIKHHSTLLKALFISSLAAI